MTDGGNAPQNFEVRTAPSYAVQYRVETLTRTIRSFLYVVVTTAVAASNI